MLELITAATFVFVASLTWLLVRMLFRPRQTLASVALPGGAYGLVPNEASDEGGNAFVKSLAAQLPQTLLAGEELDKDFRRAGYYGPYARRRFLALRNGLVILAVLATGTAAVAIGPEHQGMVGWVLMAGGIATVLGFALPRVILAIRAKQRVERIRVALPDALDMIGMCLHGGISLQECLGFVGQEVMAVHPDLAVELLMVGQQADINSFEFAIQQFAARIDAPEVVALAALVAQNQRLGTGIVDSMRDYADSLRLKRRQTAEGKASRAELFLLFPVIFCLVPSILLILWGPPILSLIEFMQGQSVPSPMGR